MKTKSLFFIALMSAAHAFVASENSMSYVDETTGTAISCQAVGALLLPEKMKILTESLQTRIISQAVQSGTDIDGLAATLKSREEARLLKVCRFLIATNNALDELLRENVPHARLLEGYAKTAAMTSEGVGILDNYVKFVDSVHSSNSNPA